MKDKYSKITNNEDFLSYKILKLALFKIGLLKINFSTVRLSQYDPNKETSGWMPEREMLTHGRDSGELTLLLPRNSFAFNV